MQQEASHGQRERPFEAGEFRAALSAFATGVTVVTTGGPDSCFGVTANAFSSVSLNPPLVLVCIKAEGGASREIGRSANFAVNILSGDQEMLSRHFAWPDRPRGPAAFRSIPHWIAASGSPILEGVAAYLDCRLVTNHRAGDHVIFIGETNDFAVDPRVSPLLFHGGRYCRVA